MAGVTPSISVGHFSFVHNFQKSTLLGMLVTRVGGYALYCVFFFITTQECSYVDSRFSYASGSGNPRLSISGGGALR